MSKTLESALAKLRTATAFNYQGRPLHTLNSDEAAALLAKIEAADRLAEQYMALVHDVQEWCDAVYDDASWDGWDSHYKSLAYGGLEEYRKPLAAYRNPQPAAEGESS